MIKKLAWRNIWRNRTRSMAVILALASGLFGALFLSGMANGMIDKTIKSSIEREISNIQIHHKDYLVMEDLSNLIAEPTVVNLLNQREGVKAQTFRLKTSAMASTANNSRQVIIMGVDPEAEKKVTTIHELIQEGTYFESNSSLDQVVISARLASKLKVKLKSKIIFSFAGLNGDIVYENYKVGGIFNTDNSLFDEGTVFVKKGNLKTLIGLNTEHCHEVAVLLENGVEESTFAANMNKEMDDYIAQTWRDINPILKVSESSMALFSYILISIVLIALIFGIINTMLMVILERTKEIGMLRSLGMARINIAKMIMLETIFLCLIGGVIGNILAFLSVSYFGTKGMRFEAFQKGFESFGMSAEVFPTIAPDYYLMITVMVFITAVISSFFPIMRAFKLDPASAIRD